MHCISPMHCIPDAFRIAFHIAFPFALMRKINEAFHNRRSLPLIKAVLATYPATHVLIFIWRQDKMIGELQDSSQ